jgi:hypothetical protein
MTDRSLSPAAQAVLDAFEDAPYYPEQRDGPSIAAALRAAADQVAPEGYSCYNNNREHDFGMATRNDEIREAILAIAAELEGA